MPRSYRTTFGLLEPTAVTRRGAGVSELARSFDVSQGNVRQLISGQRRSGITAGVENKVIVVSATSKGHGELPAVGACFVKLVLSIFLLVKRWDKDRFVFPSGRTHSPQTVLACVGLVLLIRNPANNLALSLRRAVRSVPFGGQQPSLFEHWLQPMTLGQPLIHCLPLNLVEQPLQLLVRDTAKLQ
jgi:hypothetical protein